MTVQGIFLDMKFSCNATITKLVFIALTPSDQGFSLYPEFQVWRANGSTGLYSKASSVKADNATCEGFLCELGPIETLQGQPGDVFGIHQPFPRGSRILVYFQIGGGAAGFVQSTGALDDFDTASDDGVFHYPLVAVETSAPECVEGFLDEKAVVMYSLGFDTRLRSHFGEQGLIPGLKFSCNGSLSKWTMGAHIRTTANMTYPELQIWRRQPTNFYNKVANNTITELNSTGNLNVYEFVADPPLQFESGDVIGLYQPTDKESQVVLYYNQRSRHQDDGPLNYRNETDEPLSMDFQLSFAIIRDRDIPILRVEADPQNCTSVEIISNEELIARAAEIVALTRHHDQQRIIPGINFTADGLLLTWTFTASYNPAGTMFPQLQIWRETDILTYTMVHSTDSSMEPATTGYINVYEYVLDTPIPFQAGDVFGVYQPPDEMSRLSLIYLEGGGPPNLFTPQGLTEQAQVAGDPVDEDFPLVTVETSINVTETSTVAGPTVTVSMSVMPTPSLDVSEPTIKSSSKDDSSSTGVIIGVTLGCLFAVVLAVVVIIVIVICVMRRKKRVSDPPSEPIPVEPQAANVTISLDNPKYKGATEQAKTAEAPDIGTSLSDDPPPSAPPLYVNYIA